MRVSARAALPPEPSDLDAPGIPSDQVDTAFDRFFRADPARTHHSGGAGLGLPLARSLIEAQSGSIWLSSTDGGGLTVNIALPVA